MEILKFLLTTIICFGNNRLLKFVTTSDDENRLINYLFSKQGYNPLVRPTQRSNQTVTVGFGLLLVQLIHVYEKEQIMKTNTWLHMKWYDSQLRWNPDRYGGVSQINVPFTSVWTPDVVLFNNADGNYEVTFKSKVILMYTGEVQWVPPAIYKSSCRIDVKYFPFDTQECEMRFASWTYNAQEVTFTHYLEENDKYELSKLLTQQAISVTSDQLYKDDYLESGTWDVISIPSKFIHYHTNSLGTSSDYVEVVFLIKMRRKTLYYTVNLIVPTSLMGILICVVFCLPTAAGEKMTLCMSILLALNLFQLLVTKILPPTSAVIPLIAKYLLFTFTLNVLVIVNTVIITNFYYRTPTTYIMSIWLRQIFLNVLPRLLWMNSPKLREHYQNFEYSTIFNNDKSITTLKNPVRKSKHKRIKSKHREKKNDRTSRESDASFLSYINSKRRTSTILIRPKLHSQSQHEHHHRKEKQKFLLVNNEKRLIPIHSFENSNQKQIYQMRRDIKQALDNIRYITAHCAHESLVESIRDEWKFIATVIDRLQFVVFVTVIIISLIALILQVPHLFQLYSNDSQKLIRFSNPNVTIHEHIPIIRT